MKATSFTVTGIKHFNIAPERRAALVNAITSNLLTSDLDIQSALMECFYGGEYVIPIHYIQNISLDNLILIFNDSYSRIPKRLTDLALSEAIVKASDPFLFSASSTITSYPNVAESIKNMFGDGCECHDIRGYSEPQGALLVDWSGITPREVAERISLFESELSKHNSSSENKVFFEVIKSKDAVIVSSDKFKVSQDIINCFDSIPLSDCTILNGDSMIIKKSDILELMRLAWWDGYRESPYSPNPNGAAKKDSKDIFDSFINNAAGKDAQ